jgi:hypothetical protein
VAPDIIAAVPLGGIMKRVFAIVLVGVLGFFIAVAVATLILVRKDVAVTRETAVTNGADVQVPPQAADKKVCPDSILDVEIISEVVEESTGAQRVVLCRSGQAPAILFEESAGATTLGFVTPLSEKEMQSRIAVETKGDLDGDTIPEFVLGFSQEGSTCPFVGMHRIAKVKMDGSVILSDAFGECLASPKVQKTATGSEVFLAGVNGGDGLRVFWNGTTFASESVKGGGAVPVPSENLKSVTPAYPQSAPTAAPNSAP